MEEVLDQTQNENSLTTKAGKIVNGVEMVLCCVLFFWYIIGSHLDRTGGIYKLIYSHLNFPAWILLVSSSVIVARSFFVSKLFKVDLLEDNEENAIMICWFGHTFMVLWFCILSTWDLTYSERSSNVNLLGAFLITEGVGLIIFIVGFVKLMTATRNNTDFEYSLSSMTAIKIRLLMLPIYIITIFVGSFMTYKHTS